MSSSTHFFLLSLRLSSRTELCDDVVDVTSFLALDVVEHFPQEHDQAMPLLSEDDSNIPNIADIVVV